MAWEKDSKIMFYNKTSALRRLGNKNKLAQKIINFFPKNINLLISMFYGTGSLENKMVGKVNFIIANDYDKNVYNFYDVLTNHFDELYDAIELLPYHQTAFDNFKAGLPNDSIQQAVGFLMLSNFSYLGKMDTLKYQHCKTKETLLKLLKSNYKTLVNNKKTTTQFMSCDFRKVISTISFRINRLEYEHSFIYSDPPYFGTVNNYATPAWSKKDVEDLFIILCSSGIRFAMSEFKHPYILEQANKYKLNVIGIGERKSLGNRATEILITNYKTKKIEEQELFR